MAKASLVKFNPIFEISDLNYPEIHVHIAFRSHFGALPGRCSLRMASVASDAKFDFIFEISNLNYPGIYVHVASNYHFGGPITGILVASEAMAASKRPQRSQMASELNSVTSITYVHMSFWPLNPSMS